MLFLNVNLTLEALFLLCLQEKFGGFFSYNLHLAIRVPHLWRKVTWLMWNPNVFKMAAKIEFSKNYKKISFADISEISPKRDITCMPLGNHRELKKPRTNQRCDISWDFSCSVSSFDTAGPVLGQEPMSIGCTLEFYVIFYTITSRSREHPGRSTHLNI